jgi:hypothetical protein
LISLAKDGVLGKNMPVIINCIASQIETGSKLVIR